MARKAMAPTAEELFASYVVRRNARLRMTQLEISFVDCARMIGTTRQSFHDQFNAKAITPNTILLLSACLVVSHKALLAPSFKVLHEPIPADGWQEIVSELLQESIVVTAPGTEHDFCCAVLKRAGLAACPVCNGQRRCGRDEKVCPLCFGGSQR